MAFLFYFSQWLVIDRGQPAWWYNFSLIISSVLFLITAPKASYLIDQTGKKIKGLRWWTAMSFIGFTATALMTVLVSGFELLATIFYTLAMYAYLMCFLYFTPMLNDLSRSNNRSWISGLGQGANSIGQVTGVLVTLPFVNGLTLLGEPGRAQALLPAIILFALFSLPILIFYRENTFITPPKNNLPPNSLSLLKIIWSYRPLAFMLIAYFLFSDTLITFANNFPLYLETIHGVSDTIKSLLTAMILVLAAIGAIIFGQLADKKGEVKILTWIIIAWCVIFPAMALITNFYFLIPVFLVAGLLFGPVWGISRSLVGQLAPTDLVASSYSYYVIAERFATFIGPGIWSLALITAGEDVRGYQTGLFFLTILLVISLVFLKQINRKYKLIEKKV